MCNVHSSTDLLDSLADADGGVEHDEEGEVEANNEQVHVVPVRVPAAPSRRAATAGNEKHQQI